MQRRYLKWIFLGLGVLFVLLLLMPALRGRHAGFRVKAQHDWIQKTVQELASAVPPSIQQNNQTNVVWWNSPGYLLFSNGWAAYRLHTFHDGADIGDTSVLRTSDGNFYLSEAHFCVGIGGLLSSEGVRDPNSPRPADEQDFLAHYGNFQGWALLASKEELPWCVVSCPSREATRTQKKLLWVWIATGTGTNQTTLFEKRYKIAASYISWSTRWPSNDCCVIDIYDYGRDRSPREYPESLRSNHLASFTYYLDQKTGKFVEQN